MYSKLPSGDTYQYLPEHLNIFLMMHVAENKYFVIQVEAVCIRASITAQVIIGWMAVITTVHV